MAPISTQSATLVLGVIALHQRAAGTHDVETRAQLDRQIADLCQRWTEFHGQQ